MQTTSSLDCLVRWIRRGSCTRSKWVTNVWMRTDTSTYPRHCSQELELRLVSYVHLPFVWTLQVAIERSTYGERGIKTCSSNICICPPRKQPKYPGEHLSETESGDKKTWIDLEERLPTATGGAVIGGQPLALGLF